MKLDGPVPASTACDVGAHTARQVGRYGWHRIDSALDGVPPTWICGRCHNLEAAYDRGYCPPEV